MLLLINLALGFQIRTLQQQQQALLQLIQQNQAGLALISQPGVRTLPVTGTQGRGNLVVAPDGSTAVLFLQDLPELPQEQAFQVWLIPVEGAPRSAGLFRGQSEQRYIPVLVESQEPLSNFAALGVSIEPREGSPVPTTEPILVVNF
jgi:anti-sigma-K factor RskA